MLKGATRCYTVFQGVTVADSGVGARGTVPPFFSDQTEIRRAENGFFWETASPTLSQGLDPQLCYIVLHGLKGCYTVAYGVTQ